MNEKRQEIFICHCSALDHALRLTYFPGASDGDALYIDIIMRPERSCWQRVATAIRYVFRRTCRFGRMSEMLLTPDDQRRMVRFIEGIGR